jgi:hypothetical protein
MPLSKSEAQKLEALVNLYHDDLAEKATVSDRSLVEAKRDTLLVAVAELTDTTSSVPTPSQYQRAWEYVCEEIGNRVRRLQVPGGWLYQVEFRPDRPTGKDTYAELMDGITEYNRWIEPMFISGRTG